MLDKGRFLGDAIQQQEIFVRVENVEETEAKELSHTVLKGKGKNFYDRDSVSDGAVGRGTS